MQISLLRIRGHPTAKETTVKEPVYFEATETATTHQQANPKQHFTAIVGKRRWPV
jgi:hypothetical protein